MTLVVVVVDEWMNGEAASATFQSVLAATVSARLRRNVEKQIVTIQYPNEYRHSFIGYRERDAMPIQFMDIQVMTAVTLICVTH